MATAGSNQVLASGTTATIYDATLDDGGCTTFEVYCVSASLHDAQVNVDGLHKNNEWFQVPKGESRVYRLNDNGIYYVRARGDGGATIVHYGAIARTQ